MDFPTTTGGGKDRPDQRDGRVGRFATAPTTRPSSATGAEDGTLTIPPGSRKSALVHLAREAWRAGLLDPKSLGQVRGRDVDEAGLQRALYRSSMGEIEHALAPIVKGRKVVVEGRLEGAVRQALGRLGAEVEEIRPEDEKRYIDLTPAVFVLGAVAIAVRYVSLGLDDQSTYILAGIFFALIYGLRPFLSKLQRPKDR